MSLVAKIEKFEGRFSVGGHYAYIWMLSEIDPDLLNILLAPANRQNPEPLRPVFGCNNCAALRVYKELVRNEQPDPNQKVSKNFMKWWVEDQRERSEAVRGLVFLNDKQKIAMRKDGEGVIVTGFCPVLNAIYQDELKSAVSCTEEIV